MNILDSNQKYILVSREKETLLLSSPFLSLIKKKPSSYSLGSLQYGTGIAVLCKGSNAIFYDFIHEKVIETLDTYLKLLNVCLLKNLLIAISQERILIHDTMKKENLCYIPIHDGHKVTINKDYYNLKMFYPISEQVFEQKQIWNSKNNKIQCSKAQKMVCYDKSGEILCFVEGNVLSLYQDQQIIRGCSFEYIIKNVKSNNQNGGFFVHIQEKEEQEASFDKFIFVNQSEKNYLELIEDREILFENSQRAMIVFENSLYIWEGKKLYRTQVDKNFKMNKEKQIPKKQQLIEHEESSPQEDKFEQKSQTQKSEQIHEIQRQCILEEGSETKDF